MLQGAAETRQPQICSLVTPGGDPVGFTIPTLDASSDEIAVVARENSVWPKRTLPAARGYVKPEPPGKWWFALGGADGLVLELGEPEPRSSRRTATLLARETRRPGVPLAYGFCAPPAQPITVVSLPIDEAAGFSDIGQKIAAFDPRKWPEQSCGLLLEDGRRMSFTFTLTGGDWLELASPTLWGGKKVSLSIKWLPARGVQVGAFSRRRGPEGVQTMIVDGSRAAKLIRFQKLGDASIPGAGAWGICGYGEIVRRAKIQ
jgi:hypothetical protein